MSITITVKNTTGARFEMDIPSLSETVAEFKTRLEAVSGIPASSQRLIFRGHILKNNHTFAEIRDAHGLQSGHSMHVVPSPAPRSHQSPAPSTASTQGSGAQQGTTPGTGANPGTGAANGIGFGAPFAGETGTGGWPDMTEMQQQMMRNPQQMQALMNSPIMESIMNNPQVARSLMMANPQMRELLERNPEVAHVFNDPATFRQMMQMARNPSLMNEMMRNTDRQMANIEMMPGGFDALRRMHENIQAPLMDATQGFAPDNADNAANGQEDNPFTSLFQQNTPSNTPMPNPWAPARPTPPNPGAPRTANTTANATGTPTAPTATNAFAQLFQNAGNNPTPAASPLPIPGLEGMPLPNGANVDGMLQMLENPAMQQIMQHVLSDPQLFQSMLNIDPALQARIQNNPEMARLLQNPELMRTLINPEVLRSIRQIQTALAGVNPSAGTAQTGTTPYANGTTTGTTPAPATPGANPTTGTGNPMDGFAAMMNAMAGTTTGATPAQPATTQNPTPGAGAGNANPVGNLMAMMNALAAANAGNAAAPASEMTQEQLEEMYSSQLQQLREMGFLDKSTCLQALQQSRGNVSAAIENLLSRYGG